MDEDLRKVYHSVLKEYNALLKSKKRSYYEHKLTELESTDTNLESFWKILNSMPDIIKLQTTPPVCQDSWTQPFFQFSKCTRNHE